MSETYNTLRSNAFAFNLLRLPETVFRVVNLEFPDVAMAPVASSLPGATAYFPGHTIEFGELVVRFIVDENLKNYTEIFNWLTQQQFATDYVPKNSKEELLVSDGTVTTLNNSSVANVSFMFKDLFPISLSGLQFMTNTSSPEQIECSVSFKFSYFEIYR